MSSAEGSRVLMVRRSAGGLGGGEAEASEEREDGLAPD